MFQRRHLEYLALLLCVLSAVGATSAKAVNRTIDDENGDETTGARPEYYPPDQWSQGTHCPTCSIKLDPTKNLDGTWHDTTFDADALDKVRTVTARFNGTAVYVFCTLLDKKFSLPNPTTLTALSIQLDGAPVYHFLHTPMHGINAHYQSPVYTGENLVDGPHSIVMQLVLGPGGFPSVMLFDYIIYTATEPDPLTVPPSSPQLGASTAPGSQTIPSIDTSIVSSPTPAVPMSPIHSNTSTSQFAPSSSSTPPLPNASNTSSAPLDDGVPRPSRNVTPAVVGGVVGGVALLGSIAALVCIYRKRRHRKVSAPEGHPASPHAFHRITESYRLSSYDVKPQYPPSPQPATASPTMLSAPAHFPLPPDDSPVQSSSPADPLPYRSSTRESVVQAMAAHIRELEQHIQLLEPLPPYVEEEQTRAE